MTAGLPHVCKLWLGVGKGMLPVIHLATNILMVVNYYGRQQARRLGRTAPAYHEKECEALHPGACKLSLQYDGRPDGRFGVLVGTWNLGSQSGNGEVCEELKKRMIDVLYAGEMERTGC